jgi:hypothetical protein
VSAELLRRAAKELREHAEPIRPASPSEDWCFEYAHAAIRHVERNVDLDINPCPDHGNDHGMFGRYSGRYVALMHPPVGLFLADLFDEVADSVEQEGGIVQDSVTAEAVAVARAILREESS